VKTGKRPQLASPTELAFQPRKLEPIGVRAVLPSFIEPALASFIEGAFRIALYPRSEVRRLPSQSHIANEVAKIFTGVAVTGRIASRKSPIMRDVR
jgi:hypothetical protein